MIFRTEVAGTLAPERPSYDKKLLDSVTVGGAIKLEDLRLTSSEIRTLNIAALTHRALFPSMDMQLNAASRRPMAAIGSATPLNLTLVFKTAEEAEVCCWERTVKRRDLVPHVVRSMERAKELYTHYREQIGRNRSIKRLYL
ncbi:MAG: hypothetical protein V3571_05665 [Pseudodesulfovibrio sp.]